MQEAQPVVHDSPSSVLPCPRPGDFSRLPFAAWPMTRRQTALEWLGGFLLPALCIALDWWMLRSHRAGSIFGLLPELAATGNFPAVTRFARGFIGIELAVIVVWLALEGRVGALVPFLTGALAVGAAFALLLGICLLPLTLVGLPAFGIGLLGLVPFWTALVFARQTVRCHHVALGRCGLSLRIGGFAIGAILAIAAPAASAARRSWM